MAHDGLKTGHPKGILTMKATFIMISRITATLLLWGVMLTINPYFDSTARVLQSRAGTKVKF